MSKPDVVLRFEPAPSGAKLGAGRVCGQLLVLSWGRKPSGPFWLWIGRAVASVVLDLQFRVVAIKYLVSKHYIAGFELWFRSP